MTTATHAIERRARKGEDVEAWGRVHRLGNRIHLAVVAERPDVVQQSAGELVYLASRRLVQLGEKPDDAA